MIKQRISVVCRWLTASILTIAFSASAEAACPEDYRNLVEKLFFQGFSGGNLAVVEEVFSPDIHFEDPMFPEGIEGIKALVAKNNAAMSDWTFAIEDMLCDGDKTAVRWMATGIHTGSFMGEPPTGNQVALKGIVVYQIEGNRITRDWLMSDNLGFLTQIGILAAGNVDMTQ